MIEERPTKYFAKPEVLSSESHKDLCVEDLCVESLLREIEDLKAKNKQLSDKVEWFKRQVFGEKSERRIVFDHRQLTLGEWRQPTKDHEEQGEIVKEHVRCKARNRVRFDEASSGLDFDESKVPVKVIEVPNPEVDGLREDEYELVGTRITHRLAQTPASYCILKYVQKTVKIKSSKELSTAPAVPAVLERSYADVSFLAVLIIEKFLYHLPLFRQHKRLQNAGVKLDRMTLTNYVHRTACLLEPVYNALLQSIVESFVLLMDETKIRAGHGRPGKMHQGYYWPMYGDEDEVCFVYGSGRGQAIASKALGDFSGVLVSDGYKVYGNIAGRSSGIVHAQCWTHTRRKFEESKREEPRLANEALERLAPLYKNEEQIKRNELTGEGKYHYRIKHSKPRVDSFFEWAKEQQNKNVFLQSNKFDVAVNYALNREKSLRVFLDFPEVPIDTNQVENLIRPVALGRRNYLFYSTEIGAKYGGIIYSLLGSCQLQKVCPYTYLVDVLQRIDSHPSSEVQLLTPRLWKQHFAHSPLRSAVDPPPKDQVGLKNTDAFKVAN